MKDETVINKKELLKKVWEECSFDEIIDAGFEYNKCGAIQLKAAAAEFDDPEKEYDYEEIFKGASITELDEITRALENEFLLEDIIDSFGADDLLDHFNDDDLLEHLENSDALRYHDEDVENNYHDKMYEEIMDELFDCYEFNKKEFMKELEESNADDLHVFLCNLLGIGYYDKEGFKIKWKKFIDKLNKNSYDIKYKE